MREHSPRLSDRQRRLIERAANAVPAGRRDEFLTETAKRLNGEPSDAAVLCAVNLVLDRMRTAA